MKEHTKSERWLSNTERNTDSLQTRHVEHLDQGEVQPPVRVGWSKALPSPPESPSTLPREQDTFILWSCRREDRGFCHTFKQMKQDDLISLKMKGLSIMEPSIGYNWL